MTYKCTVNNSNQVWLVTANDIVHAKTVCKAVHGFWPDNVVQMMRITKDAYRHEQAMRNPNDD